MFDKVLYRKYKHPIAREFLRADAQRRLQNQAEKDKLWLTLFKHGFNGLGHFIQTLIGIVYKAFGGKGSNSNFDIFPDKERQSRGAHFRNVLMPDGELLTFKQR